MANQELKDNIVSWLTLDNDIKSLQKQLRIKRKEKKSKTDEIVNVMKSNEIACFDTNDGKLIYTTTKTKAPLSKKHLLTSLTTYFNNDPNTIQTLSEFILNSRKDNVKETIKRKIKKQ
jgi:hypothetical protein|uniref:Uncharacterized protein n=1 Tax=viral metagenome TaxID=1070528 RepID=A0A6C0C3M8_9ZZZZ